MTDTHLLYYEIPLEESSEKEQKRKPKNVCHFFFKKYLNLSLAILTFHTENNEDYIWKLMGVPLNISATGVLGCHHFWQHPILFHLTAVELFL